MNGLHVCKAGNAPQVGQVKSFVVTGDRIKSKPLDQGGQNYTITKVTQHETYKDAYGNLGFNLEIEPQNGAPQAHAAPQRVATAGWSDDRSSRIERQHSQEMALRYFAMVGGFPEGKTPTESLRTMTSWFQRDIGQSPEKSQPEVVDKHPYETEPPIESDEEEAF